MITSDLNRIRAVFIAREAIRAMALDGKLKSVRRAAAKSTRKPKRGSR